MSDASPQQDEVLYGNLKEGTNRVKKLDSSATMRAVEIEEEIIGSMIRNISARQEALHTMIPSQDFTSEVNIAIYNAIAEIHDLGLKVGVSLVTEKARKHNSDVTREQVERIAGKGVVIGSIAEKLDILADKTTRREIDRLCRLALDMVKDPAVAPEDVITSMRNFSPFHLSPTGGASKIYSVHDYLNVDIEEATNWVIPSFIGQKERMIIMGDKGIGKSTLLRQIAFLASIGKHPFTFEDIPPKKVLLVDFENSSKTIRKSLAALYSQAEADNIPQDWTKSNLGIWDRKKEDGRVSGFSPHTRLDANQLAYDIQDFAPDLVVIGPIYKMTKPGESATEGAAELLTRYIDDLRSRFKAAFIMEAHPPHPSTQSNKWIYRKGEEMRQYGSTIWGRWPDYILTLYKDINSKNLTVDVTKSRDEEVSVPSRLNRGVDWPWEPEVGFDE